jgi:hypothetical protein
MTVAADESVVVDDFEVVHDAGPDSRRGLDEDGRDGPFIAVDRDDVAVLVEVIGVGVFASSSFSAGLGDDGGDLRSSSTSWERPRRPDWSQVSSSELFLTVSEFCGDRCRAEHFIDGSGGCEGLMLAFIRV